MEPKTRKLTTRWSAIAAVVSFLAQPIPAADELIVVPIHYWLAVRIAKARGVRSRDLPWPSIKKIIWYGAGARLVANFSLGLIPFVGAFSNAITAIALTEHLGRWLDDYIKDPANPPAEITMDELKKTFANAISARSKKKAQGATA